MTMEERELLERAAREAMTWLDTLDDGPVGVRASYEDLSRRIDRPLPDDGVDPGRVLDDLVLDTRGGLLRSGGPRFFGWVIGGALPVALGADWLVSAWDQNGAIYQTSPAAAVLEEVAGRWLKEVLDLPDEASFAMVTGCQMAHLTALAAARHRLLADRGIDVGAAGLYGAPPIRVITGPHRHETLLRALRMLGMGSDHVRQVDLDADGRMDPAALAEALEEDDAPTVIATMAGDLNTGAADPFPEICSLAGTHKAWVHVDGAFGLWLRASARNGASLDGVELADSWATDGHKWLNVPFDSGYAFVRDAEAHHAAMTMTASYIIAADAGGRDPMNWNPEWSRRARGIVTYAALRALGRSGVEEIVDRCCRLCDRLVRELGALPGAEIVHPARMNQGLVRFRDPDGDHDARTEAVATAVREEGTAWFGGATWNGVRVMRISVCGYRTTDEDVERTVDAVRRVLEELDGGSPRE